MTDLTVTSPAFLVLAAALAMPLLSRRVGHAVGSLASLGAIVWSALVREGVHLRTEFLGFDAVLFNVEPASRLVAAVFAFVGVVAVLYSYASEADNRQTAFALSYVGTGIGAIFAGDWLTFVFFVELMGVASTLLVWTYGGAAVRSGFRYALWHGLGGSLILAGIVWHYVEVGTFVFATSGTPTGITTDPILPALLYAVGFGVNVGFVGLHVWLPDTYPSPHIAASVFLSVYTTKTGVYGLWRGFPDDGHLMLAYMGTAMAVYGAYMSVVQTDMRRLLAYQIQSQVGFLVAGVGIGSALATAGVFAHVVNHIIYDALLFMAAGAIIYRTDVEDLRNLGNLRSTMPFTGLIFLVGALAITGFPGVNGFVSKGMILTAVHHEHYNVLWYLLLFATAGTFVAFVKFGYYAFLREVPNGDETLVSGPELTLGHKAGMVSVATLCVLFGLYPEALFELLPGKGASKAHPFTVEHFAEGFGLAALGLVGFAVLRKPISMLEPAPDVDYVYNRVAFYGTRTLVVAVTELYAAIDRVVVSATTGVTWAARNPVLVLARYTPWWVLPEQTQVDGDSELNPELQASIGQGTFIVVGVLVALLGLLFVF